MHPSCPVCNGESAYLLDKDGYDLYRCKKCALIFVFPQPTLEYLRTKVYSAASGFQKGRAVEDVSKTPLSRRKRESLALMERLRSGGRILDIGCGSGSFLYRLQERGFTAEGVELNDRLAGSARAQGFTVYQGTLEEADVPPGRFDIVFMGEVIEHVPNPRGLIRSALRALKDSGILIITTPNMDCLWSRATFGLYRLFRIPWSSATPPYHLFQFSAPNLNRLVAEEGYRLCEAVYLPAPPLRYELGMLHLLKRYKQSRKLRDLAFMAFAFALYILLYGACRLAHPFLSRDFSMVHAYAR